MEERRQFVRLSSRLTAAYKVIGAAESDLPALTRNIGAGGVAFFTESYLEPGTLLQVEVKFPDREWPVRFTAEVIWSGELLLSSTDRESRAFETGVRFTNISDEDRQFLVRYSTSTPPLPSKG